MIFAELIYKQNHSTPKIIPHHATKKPSETIVPEGTVLLVNMKLRSPRQKELTAAQAGEIFLNVQFVSRGGGSEGVDDGTGFGTFDGVGKQPIFSSDDKGADGILGAIVIQRDVAVLQAAVKILLFVEAVLHRLGKLGAAADTQAAQPREKTVKTP